VYHTTNTTAVTPSTGLYQGITVPSKCVLFSITANYIGVTLESGRAIVVNIRNSTSLTTEGTIIATQTLSNGSEGPFRLQNFSSTFDPLTPSYIQVQVSTLGATIGNANSNVLFVSLATY
jgi:hypothetical protein